MNDYMEIELRNDQWLFIVPITNILLTKVVDRELKIDRVTFISKGKLPYVRLKYNFPERISEMKKEVKGFKKFIESENTFAILYQSGRPKDIKYKCYRMVLDEISILASSQLGYTPRRFKKTIGISGEVNTKKFSNLFFNLSDGDYLRQFQTTSSLSLFTLHENWKSWQNEMFFTNLLKILQKNIRVSSNWRKDLKKASILVGKSYLTNDIPVAFLFNMIALEVLLTHKGDKYPDDLLERIEALLGWAGFWKENNFKERIERIYYLRSSLVHDWETSDITKKDLLFTDDLIFNLLLNICKFTNIIKSKNDIISFSERVKAEKILEIEPTVRPKDMEFVSRHYSQKDFEEF